MEFLKKIFEKLLHQIIRNNTCIISVWDEYFKRIRILDSTAFQVPESYKDIYPGSGGCSQPSGVKIQLEYELKSGKLVNELLGISIYIANIEEAVLSAEQVHEFYSLRWQVEIIFKTWKSIYHIHGVKPVKIERFQCQLYGKLILLLLSSTVMFKMRTLVLENRELETSEIKASEIVHEYIDRLYFELIKFPSRTFNTLKLVFENIIRNGLKSHRKDKKTVFDILGVRYKRSSMRAKIAA